MKINKVLYRLFGIFVTKNNLLYFFTIFFALPIFVQAQTAMLPPPPMPPFQHTAPRSAGQKYIEEVWSELENATFATPTFEELGTLHEGYSFEEIWELARKSNPSLRKKANLITAARGQKTQKSLYPNPTLFYAGDNLGVNDKIGKHGLAISQEIVPAKKKKLDRAIASFDVIAAQKEYSMECVKLHNDLHIAYNELIHAILICKVEQFAQDISNDLLQVAKTLQAAGKSNSIDVLQFQTMLFSSALNLKQAENNRLAKWQNLVSIAGIPDLPYQPVRGSLIDRTPRRDWKTTWTQFQHTSPQLELANLKITQARSQLARAKADRTSNVVATFSMARDIPAKKTVPFVGILLPLNIYDRNQGNIAKAGAEVAVTNREVERLTLSLQKRLAEVFYRYDNACELIRVYEKNIIPDSFEALRKIGENYSDGKMTYLELYAQRKFVINTLLQYIDALKTKAITTIQIDGMLLEGTLD
ncbi:MAG: TolC family protein [Planctomycetaceae bacterium]|jgi:cobalt-zinc-cadmium efflux system outer membrane protein|nr:TolC family protein [Planctomycetaceae bacterium]